MDDINKRLKVLGSLLKKRAITQEQHDVLCDIVRWKTEKETTAQGVLKHKKKGGYGVLIFIAFVFIFKFLAEPSKAVPNQRDSDPFEKINVNALRVNHHSCVPSGGAKQSKIQDIVPIHMPIKNGKVAAILRTNRIKFKEGDAFGYAILLKPGIQKVGLVEQLKVPYKPLSWANIGDGVISQAGTMVTTPRKLKRHLKTEVAFSVWTLIKGDPIGRHEFELCAEDGYYKKFEMEITP